ncbi:hypothetical protein E4U21_002769 [Claviceps maximensis]|nr:hypothetical protein E4U21_002769 [Claviceps maximensis]
MSSISRRLRPITTARPALTFRYGPRRYSAPAAARGSLPLEGYRVLDMTRVLAGPYCTQLLGDMGAEVIKIEHPVRGDDTRAWGPPYAPYKLGSHVQGSGESAYFLGANRNKKSLGLSFQHKEGVDILHKLVVKCDILVENYLPGTLKKYSMDYDALRKINPGLIYASITGYGQTGPYSSRAGYDVMVEAEFGLMHITGQRDGPPVKVGVAVTDLTTGLYTSNSIMAALLGKVKTGRGQHIDVALSDCQTATLANIASSCLISGNKDSGRWGTAHPSIVPYRSFKTKDGDILLGGGNDRLFGILADGLGKPEWKEDAKFKTNADRVSHRDELEAMIEAVSQQKTTEEWLQRFEGSGLPYAAINDVQATLNHEHTKARNMVVEMNHEACGPIKMVNTPVKFSETQPSIRSVAPMLGQHTDEVLEKYLGLSKFDIAALKEKGISSFTSLTSSSRRLLATQHFNTFNLRRIWLLARMEFYYPRSDQSSHAPPHLDSTSTSLADETADRIPSNQRAAYVPQFSASSALILSRIRGTNAEKKSHSLTFDGLQSRTHSPCNDELLVSAVSSTVALPNGAGAHDNVTAAGIHQHQIAAVPSKLKRKLSPNFEIPDFTQNTIPFPSVKTSSTVPTAPQPLQPLTLVKDEFQSDLQLTRSESSLWEQRTIEVVQEQMLSPAVSEAHSEKSELWGFQAGEASDVARTQYFMQKKRADLLNVLSFCDQLQPQLLVDIMVSVSKKHPDLPMFDSADWQKSLHDSLEPQREPIKTDRRTMGTSRHGHTVANPKARQRQKNAKKALRRLILAQNEDDTRPVGEEGENENEEAEEDTLPPSWPKAGEGLYSKLPLETEDRTFLTDDNDEESFSQFMVDKTGNPIMVSVCA